MRDNVAHLISTYRSKSFHHELRETDSSETETSDGIEYSRKFHVIPHLRKLAS